MDIPLVPQLISQSVLFCMSFHNLFFLDLKQVYTKTNVVFNVEIQIFKVEIYKNAMKINATKLNVVHAKS